MEEDGGTVSAAVREHLRQLCLQEFPCGAGSWVRAQAGRPGGGGRDLGVGGDGPARAPGLRAGRGRAVGLGSGSLGSCLPQGGDGT